jgi:hypothetical protein
MLSASIYPKSKRMLANGLGEIIRELDVPGNGCSDTVLPNGGYRAVGEIEVRECIGGGMGGGAYWMIEDQSELRDGWGSGDGEGVILVVIGEPKTEFVYQGGSNRIVVRSYEAAILIVGRIIRQKITGGGNYAGAVELAIKRILEALAQVDLLFSIEIVIDANIEAVGVRGIRPQGLIVIGRI